MNDDEEIADQTPQRRDGTYLVFEFEGPYDDVPAILDRVAEWLRLCAEYAVEQINIQTDWGWTTVAVTVLERRAGDIIQRMTEAGWDEAAASLGTLVTHHGLREGLRRAGFASR